MPFHDFAPGMTVISIDPPHEWTPWLARGSFHVIESMDYKPGTEDLYLKLLGSPSTWLADRFRPATSDELAQLNVAAEQALGAGEADPVNHPAHYGFSNGVEVIDLTEQLDFLRGNAVKYLARAGRKDGADELEGLRKAQWYVDRAVSKLDWEREQAVQS